LPSLRAKENDVLLRELLKRWSTHKVITCWLSRFFRSLEIFGITEISLEKIGFLSFYDLVGHDNISLKLSFFG
jgi:cullin 1